MKLLGSNSWVLQIDIENFFFKIGYHLGEKLDSIITRKEIYCVELFHHLNNIWDGETVHKSSAMWQSSEV